MEEIKKLISLPKEILDKSEKLLKSLFGGAVEETGAMISDRIRYQRFKNQVAIFSKAQALLEQKNIKAKPISLKILVPLLDFSGLEEEPATQEKWANIIANLAVYDSESIFNKNCVELLNKLTPVEIAMMDYYYDEFTNRQGEVISQRKDSVVLKDFDEIHSTDILFNPFDLIEVLKVDKNRIKLYTENLITYGLLQFEELDFENDGLVTSSDVYITYLGLYFVRLCKFK